MNQQGLQNSFWTMIIVQTLGSIDMPGHGDRKMPAPRQYVAIVVTWLVLQIVSTIGAATERATAAIGWALVLTGLVVGPFGKQIVNLFSIVATQFGRPAQLFGIQPGSTSTLTPNPPTGVTLASASFKNTSTLTPNPPAGVTLRP